MVYIYHSNFYILVILGVYCSLVCAEYTFLVPDTPDLITTTSDGFPSSYEYDYPLWLLQQSLSENALMSFKGSPGQVDNYNKYWGRNIALNATVVVYPATPADVSLTIQAAALSYYTVGFAVVGGGHGLTKGSSSTSLVIDLAYLNSTQIINDVLVNGELITMIAYEGGGRWRSVYNVTAGSGFVAIGAREDTVGVGGTTTCLHS